ncbi:unnamed protein product [Closterium sp. NIES-53]
MPYPPSDHPHSTHLSPSPSPLLPTQSLSALSSRQAADSRFENASVAFDPVSLRPSFHILWGGTSHALSLAASRGLPPSLVARAARLARAATLEAGEEEDGREEEEGRGYREGRQGGESEGNEYVSLRGGRGEGEEVRILASLML